MPPTPAQLRTLAETVIHGTTIEAAACLGISTQTAKAHLLGLRRRVGARSTIQAAYRLGWLWIPPAVGTQHHSG